jgi:DnaJ-class molecular chaperone
MIFKVSIHTHYNNLRVAHDAPIEVIEASKKALLAKYSDKNFPKIAEAQRLRTVIRTSYAILSDAEKRKIHDAWIVAQLEKSKNATPQTKKYLKNSDTKALNLTAPHATNNDQLYFGLSISIIVIISLMILFYL